MELRTLNIAKRLRHGNLISTVGAWHKQGWLITAMELAERSLYDRLQEVQAGGQAGIPADELLGYMRDAARGIDFLNHPDDVSTGGVQHRDIKPQNLLLVGGCVKVADFGIARAISGVLASHTGSMSPHFSPPEFFEGRTSDRSDQYSLAVAYCLLRSGRLPFDGVPSVIMRGHLDRSPDLNMLPAGGQPVVGRTLSKRAEGRWASCAAMVDAIREAAESGQQPTLSAVASCPPRLTANRRKRLVGRWTVAGLVGLVLAGIAATSPWWLTSGDSPRGQDLGENSVPSTDFHEAADLLANFPASVVRYELGTCQTIHLLSGPPLLWP